MCPNFRGTLSQHSGSKSQCQSELIKQMLIDHFDTKKPISIWSVGRNLKLENW